MGLLQLLRTADQHNDIVAVTNKQKKSNRISASCFPSAFKDEWLSSVLQYHSRRRGRETLQVCKRLLVSKTYGKGREKRLLVFKTYGNCYCDTPHLTLSGWISKGNIFTCYFRHFMSLCAQRGRPAEESSMLLWCQGQVYFWREGGRHYGRKARLQREDRPCVLFPIICVFPFPWHSLSHYKVLPQGISAKFFPKCLGIHQVPAGWLLFTELLRSSDTYPLFPATEFSTFFASENVFVENPLYQPWWDKPSWEPQWGRLPPKGASRHLAWMFIDLQQCSKTCENSILQFYWDIWKVHSQRLPLLTEIQMPQIQLLIVKLQ